MHIKITPGKNSKYSYINVLSGRLAERRWVSRWDVGVLVSVISVWQSECKSGLRPAVITHLYLRYICFTRVKHECTMLYLALSLLAGPLHCCIYRPLQRPALIRPIHITHFKVKIDGFNNSVHGKVSLADETLRIKLQLISLWPRTGSMGEDIGEKNSEKTT